MDYNKPKDGVDFYVTCTNVDRVEKMDRSTFTLKLKKDQIDFLCEIGLPNHIKSFEWRFDLSNITACSNNVIFDWNTKSYKTLLNSDNEPELLYKIGYENIGCMSICIQQSDGGIYYASNRNMNCNEQSLERESYLNCSIIAFARCLVIYDNFHCKYVEEDRYLNFSQDERMVAIKELESSLQRVDPTIMGTGLEIRVDDYWSSFIEQTGDYIEIDDDF